MNKNKTTNILVIALITILILSTTIIISTILTQNKTTTIPTPTQDKTITIEQAIKDVNNQEKTKYTYNQIIFYDAGSDNLRTQQLSNKIWILYFIKILHGTIYIYIDNNHKITKQEYFFYELFWTK